MKSPRLASRALLFGMVAFGFLLASVDAQVISRKSRSSRTARKDGPFTTGSSDEIIEFINARITSSYEDNEVKPSPIATDAEWIRRVYLDIVGHIPESDVVEAFLKDKDRAKRARLIDRLLDEEGYVRNFTTIWTNLCIGRGTPRRVSRRGMTKFFREAFARNRPWDDIVVDLVTGEGHFEENGEVNYLLAQMTMRDDMVQATAKTTRLFLGVQVQCTQCHDHPFNDWKQSQFWQINSFFRQAQRRDYRKPDPQTGRLVDDYSELVFNEGVKHNVFYDKRNGTMNAAYPIFFDQRVDGIEHDEVVEVDLRKRFGDFIREGEKPLIAQAAVNRMWGHFFGYGFTKPVDDMGPHKSVSHPDLFDRLSREFVKSNYDVKQLIRWICNSEAYNRTSQFGRDNEVDDPGAGEMPLFSHLYVKSMEAEQLYDSLIIATNAHRSGRSSWDQAERQRQQWLQQFVIAFGTDENDEATTFNGTIPQALMMMNGDLVQNATSGEKGSFLQEVLAERGSDVTKINRLYLATLSRLPTANERKLASNMIKGNRNKLAAYQDLLWALLNSNEFIFVH